jgi:hypothetical protein
VPSKHQNDSLPRQWNNKSWRQAQSHAITKSGHANYRRSWLIVALTQPQLQLQVDSSRSIVMDAVHNTGPDTIISLPQLALVDVAMTQYQPQPEITMSSPVPKTLDKAPTTPPHSLLTILDSTPVKIESSTTLPYTTNQKFRIQSHNTMGTEMRKYLVRPMPAEQFLDDFFSSQRDRWSGYCPCLQGQVLSSHCHSDKRNAGI